MKKEPMDLEALKKEAARRMKGLPPGTGIDTILRPMLKEFLESMLEGEMDAHMEQERSEGNRRNGKLRKTVKTREGAFELETPRDRHGTFEPQAVGKRQTLVSEEIELKVLRLYAKGLSVRDICDEIEELYGFSLSPATMSTITDRVIPMLKEWKERPLEAHYSFVWLDAMFYKVREDGRVQTRALYNIIGINPEGCKELLGIYVAESESASFWMQVLDDLRRRGIQSILIVCTDNLKGLDGAISTIFPQSELQLCIIHQMRNSFKYVAYKDSRAFTTDLRTVYQASTRQQAEDNLELLEQKWGKKYGVAIRSWRDNWPRLSTYFQYPEEIRKVIYTTNIIEGFHRQVRKVTKTKGAFTSDMALQKLVYLATTNVVKKWRRPIANWAIIASQLTNHFGDRAHIGLSNHVLKG
jgi:transposase-like protein